MNIGLVNRDSFFDNQRAFKLGITPDGIADGWFYIKKQFEKLGNSFTTIESMEKAKNCDILIFNEIPKKKTLKFKFTELNIPKYLIILESPLVLPDNYNKDNFKFFSKIFTWDNSLVAISDKFIKINFTCPVNSLYNPINIEIEREKEVCIVAGNKLINGKGELYSYRKNLIKFFDTKLDQINFDLYGGGWGNYKTSSHNLIGKIRNRLFKNYKITAPKCWRGRIDSKMNIYSNYNFSFAIENAYMYDGYITEKIIHSLLSLTMPLYLGDKNIINYIPEEFYIDINGLKFQEIIELINSKSPSDLVRHRKNLTEFINNGGLEPFDINSIIKTLCQEIL